jgi:hypothetical protein
LWLAERLNAAGRHNVPEEVKHCAFAGQDQNGAALLQVVVRISETEKAY